MVAAPQWVENPDLQMAVVERAAQMLVDGKAKLSFLGQKNDPASVGGQGPYMHGGGGLLAAPGQNPVIFSSIVQPDIGVWSALPFRNTPVVSPEYGGIDVELITTLTGVTSGNVDDFNNQPNASCDDAPIAGMLKACTLPSPYGSFAVRTNQIDIKHVGRLSTRAEEPNFQLQNTGINENPFTPTVMPQGGSWINDEIQARLYEAAIGWQRVLAPQTYTGNPANNKAGGGARQFVGLDLIINTGNKVDFFTQNLCSGMDSALTNFGSVNIDEADANGFYIYDWVEAMMYYLQANADRMGMSPVKWVVAMRRDLFYQLTRFWRVQSYVQNIRMVSTLNTTNKDGAQIVLSGQEEAQLRDEMYQGRFLSLPNGQRLEVIFDDGIAVTTGSPASEFVSSMYFIPVTAMGNVPITYWQYFNYDNGQARNIMQMARGQIWTSDGGKFIWTFNQRNGCFETQYWGSPRLMMHAPYLAGRIYNVGYQPLIASRSAYPVDNNFYNGGRTNSPLPLGYGEWSTSTPVWAGTLP